MFLFDKEIKKEFLKNTELEILKFPEFIAWKFGPFSKEIYNDIEFFINNGFIEDTTLDILKNEVELDEFENWEDDYLLENFHAENIGDFYEEKFMLTEKGLKFVEEKYYSTLTENQKKIARKFKSSINKSSLAAILRYTYLKYPEFSIKSTIRKKIVG